ncbi:MAG: SNF2 helicase-associated domain-containing protein, partial [Janthinobacterium lividum]
MSADLTSSPRPDATPESIPAPTELVLHATSIPTTSIPTMGLAWWIEGVTRTTTGRRHPRAVTSQARRRVTRTWGGDAAAWSLAVAAPARQLWLLLPVQQGRPVSAGESADALAPVLVGVAVPSSTQSLDALLSPLPPQFSESPEVGFLRELAIDAERLVHNGRVLPVLDGDRAGWRLVEDHDVVSWRIGRARALPAALRAAVATGHSGAPRTGQPADEVVDRLLAGWIPALVAKRLRPGGDGAPLVEALRTHAALTQPRPALAADLQRWATSARARRFALVLRLDEPSPSLDDDGLARVGGDRWPLEFLLRIDEDAPVTLSRLHADDTAREALQDGLARTLDLIPALQHAERDPFEAGTLWLSTTDVTELVDRGRQALQEGGIDLLLPREWARRETTLQLGVGPQEDAAIGLSGLLSWRWSVALGDDVLTDEELARLAAEKSDLVRLRGEWVRLDTRHLADARRYLREASAGAAELGGSLGELLGELLEADLPVPLGEVRATGWVRGLFDATPAVPDVKQPRDLDAQLRPYQRRGLAWLAFMDERGLGAVLADDMGLGKTIQVLALLLHEREEGTVAGPTLLVAPTSLLTNWAREAQRFAPG